MNYNKTTKAAHFYSEDGEQFEQLKGCDAERIHEDACLELRKCSIEIGTLEVEEECIDDLFAMLNEELNIDVDEARGNGNKRVLPPSQRVEPKKPAISVPKKIPTALNEEDSAECLTFDFLFTKDKHKKSKVWHDGVVKYYPTRKLAEFWDESGSLVHKKIMDEVKSGEIFETASLIIEVSGSKNAQVDEISENKNSEVKQESLAKPVIQRKYPPSKPREEPQSQTQSDSSSTSASASCFEIVYTADKHKKNSKKWLDGWVNWNAASGNACFYNEEGRCFYKRIFAAGQIVPDAEFESGQYLFQIGAVKGTNDTIIKEPPPLPKSITPSKKPKLQSIMSNASIPLTGRSDSELLSLLQKNSGAGSEAQ